MGKLNCGPRNLKSNLSSLYLLIRLWTLPLAAVESSSVQLFDLYISGSEEDEIEISESKFLQLRMIWKEKTIRFMDREKDLSVSN